MLLLWRELTLKLAAVLLLITQLSLRFPILLCTGTALKAVPSTLEPFWEDLQNAYVAASWTVQAKIKNPGYL